MMFSPIQDQIARTDVTTVVRIVKSGDTRQTPDTARIQNLPHSLVYRIRSGISRLNSKKYLSQGSIYIYRYKRPEEIFIKNTIVKAMSIEFSHLSFSIDI